MWLSRLPVASTAGRDVFYAHGVEGLRTFGARRRVVAVNRILGSIVPLRPVLPSELIELVPPNALAQAGAPPRAGAADLL
jgi:hypothetical protein